MKEREDNLIWFGKTSAYELRSTDVLGKGNRAPYVVCNSEQVEEGKEVVDRPNIL